MPTFLLKINLQVHIVHLSRQRRCCTSGLLIGTFQGAAYEYLKDTIGKRKLSTK